MRAAQCRHGRIDFHIFGYDDEGPRQWKERLSRAPVHALGLAQEAAKSVNDRAHPGDA